MRGRKERHAKSWKAVSQLAPRIGVAQACRLLKVSRQGYYKWLERRGIESKTRYRIHV